MDYRKTIDVNNKIKKYLMKLEGEIFLPLYKVEEVALTEMIDQVESIVQIPSEFSGRNDYFKLTKVVNVPVEIENQTPAIKIDFGKTMGGFNGGFESLLYIDGMRICAVDTYHNCINIPKQFHGRDVCLEFEIWTGFEGGGEPQQLIHRLSRFEVGYEKKVIRELYLNLQAISEVYQLANINSELKLKYRNCLQQVKHYFESEQPYQLMYDYIMSFISSLDKTEEVELMLFGHAHIDLAWLWTLENGREKTIRTLSSVISHCQEFEKYKYIHSSPQIFSYLKEHETELFNQVCELVKNGQIEIEGGMWVEADCNLPSGESLSKQILHGKRFILDNFEYESKVLWLPDVFGYSWALPQLLNKSGINTFMTTKISWNKFNKMPTETFNWIGIDGSKVLTHFMTTPEPRSKHWNKTYTAEITADLLDRTWSTYEDQLVNQKLPVAYGYGDGGGGPTREMIELIEIYDKLPGVPQLSYKSLSESASELHESIDQKNISSWDGELYLEYHRGTFTTQGLIKKYNKRAEQKLKKLEIAIVVSNKFELNERLKGLWQQMLLYQFHDILPGSSLYEANLGVIAEYQELFTEIDELMKLCHQDEKSLFVFNHHLNHTEHLIAEYTCSNSNMRFMNEGLVLNSYYFEGKHFIDIPHIDALDSIKLDHFERVQPEPLKLEANKILKTPSFNIKFDEYGAISQLIDCDTSESLIGDFANKLVIYNDYPLNFDAWDFDVDYQESVNYPQLIERVIKQNDDHQTIILQHYNYNQSTIEEQIVINHYSKLITFNHQVNWQESNKFLRSLTSSGIRASKFTAGTQFGHIERKNNSNTSWDLAQFEICAHNYVDLSQRDRGLSIVADYKYGFNCEADVIGISLLRSPKYPDYLADMGTHTYSYHLLPHENDFANSNVYQKSFKMVERLDATNSQVKQVNSKLLSDLNLNNSNIEITSIAPGFSGESIIIRVVEVCGGRTYLDFSNSSATVREVRIDEQPINNHRIVSKIALNPFEVKTLEVKYD